jgi:hypothetical protein
MQRTSVGSTSRIFNWCDFPIVDFSGEGGLMIMQEDQKHMGGGAPFIVCLVNILASSMAD